MPSRPPRYNPYVGPQPYRRGGRLFGRYSPTSELLDRLFADRVVVLHSPSGAGKTSLIQAGLMPRLEAEGFRVWPTIRVSRQPPGDSGAAGTFNRYVLGTCVSLEEGLPPERKLPLQDLVALSLSEYLDRIENSEATESGPAIRPSINILIFDQFEEIFTGSATDLAEKTEFFEQLGRALLPRHRGALFALREDHLAALEPYAHTVPSRFNSRLRLNLLTAEEARAAVQGPAREAGVDFTDEAVQLLVDDLRSVRVQLPDGSTAQQAGPYIEPIQLQVICYRLWEQLPADPSRVTAADIEAVGSADSALIGYYDGTISHAAATTGVGEHLIRTWVEEQLITSFGTRNQVLMGPKQSAGLENTAIRELEDAHLVRAEKRGGATWFELASDRLVEPVRASNAAFRRAHKSAPAIGLPGGRPKSPR